MALDQALGFAAACVTTASAVPQVIKAARTRHTKDISLWMFVMICTGVVLWLVYGIMIRNVPLILANALTLAVNLIVLILKLRYG